MGHFSTLTLPVRGEFFLFPVAGLVDFVDCAVAVDCPILFDIERCANSVVNAIMHLSDSLPIQ